MAALPEPPDPNRPQRQAPSLATIEPHLREAAGILLELSKEIETLGVRLCMDPGVMARHMTELQVIDLIVQKQTHLAELLLADCPHAAVDAMGVDAVKQRIGQSLQGRSN